MQIGIGWKTLSNLGLTHQFVEGLTHSGAKGYARIVNNP